jgi:hypothetical protein
MESPLHYAPPPRPPPVLAYLVALFYPPNKVSGMDSLFCPSNKTHTPKERGDVSGGAPFRWVIAPNPEQFLSCCSHRRKSRGGGGGARDSLCPCGMPRAVHPRYSPPLLLRLRLSYCPTVCKAAGRARRTTARPFAANWSFIACWPRAPPRHLFGTTHPVAGGGALGLRQVRSIPPATPPPFNSIGGGAPLFVLPRGTAGRNHRSLPRAENIPSLKRYLKTCMFILRRARKERVA